MQEPTRLDHDDVIGADIDALRHQSQNHLRSLDAVVDGSTTRTTRGIIMTANKRTNRWLRLGVAVAVLAMTGAVFAATQGSLFSIWVDTDGMSEEQVEDEIRDQLVDEGVDPSRVRFNRRGNGTSRLDIAGTKGDREFRLVRKEVRAGGDDDDAPSTVIQMEPPQLDTEREPGMSDEQLEAKIRAQIEQLGLEGRVKVNGDDVEVRIMRREVVCEGDDQDCEDHDIDDIEVNDDDDDQE